MSRHHLRGLAACVSAALLASGVAGCGQSQLRSDAELDTSAYPALSTTQVDDVLDSLAHTLETADKDRTSESLQARLENPALSMRLSQYRLNAANKDLAVPSLVADPVAVSVSKGPAWPRAILDVTGAADGATPLVLVLRQADARSPYRLWQWMHLLPKQSVPPTAAVAAGSQLRDAADGKDLAMSGQQAKDAWAKSVTDADAQKSAGIDTDEFMANIRDEQKNWQQAIGQTGTLSYTVSPADDLLVFSDEDGGALVATSYTYRTDVAIKSGEGGIEMGGDVGALLGEGGKVTGKAHWTYTITVLIHVPAADADNASTRVIAGEKVLTEATRD
ncbi:hypothetical protein H8R18_02680 [Nanchangia anserum]|uniref:Lipoprotein n=1 Tax=Nanchangia anserum TaxID=2692125 RepID=A0A8I0GFK5_9ACTO|nr:hypothetical protein [Nanchangia anserum]MBD3689922.1 hypothetical protein [Nanchangia anserum]QOX82263.1 hypothetical protein H8R18_02680 [Nanchangia anserum]